MQGHAPKQLLQRFDVRDFMGKDPFDLLRCWLGFESEQLPDHTQFYAGGVYFPQEGEIWSVDTQHGTHILSAEINCAAQRRSVTITMYGAVGQTIELHFDDLLQLGLFYICAQERGHFQRRDSTGKSFQL